jgi:ThiF family
VKPPLTLRLSPALYSDLQSHLFPGDGDEHGAVLAASVLTTDRGSRLLGHRLFLAHDGVDYVPGERGYRALTAEFVMNCALACAELGMAYLAIHCHGGLDSVRFSSDDMNSHERGYPALLDILGGPPVGALVFAKNAVAGDIWLSDRTRRELEALVVPDRPISVFSSSPRPRPPHADARYDRQARLFGDRGQDLLRRFKVGVIGAGGAGSLIIEQLAHLGVGELVVLDPDRIEPANLPRVVGSNHRDTRPIVTHPRAPGWLRRRGELLRTSKVAIARRVVRTAAPRIHFLGSTQDITVEAAAALLLDTDYLFLAADSMQARLVGNAIVNQYLIPGVQMGVKALIDRSSGEVIDLFTATRPLIPGAGCLWCNGLISPARLQEEATSGEQRRHQRYVEEDALPAPSVITLNAVAASSATTDFLLSATGLLVNPQLEWAKTYPMKGVAVSEVPRRDPRCPECSATGRLGRGPTRRLPVRHLDNPERQWATWRRIWKRKLATESPHKPGISGR